MSRMTSKHVSRLTSNTSLKKYTLGISLLQYIQQTVNSIINYAIKFNKLVTLKNNVLIVCCKRQTIPNKKNLK